MENQGEELLRFYESATNITLNEQYIEAIDNFGNFKRGRLEGRWKDFFEKMLADKVKGDKRKSADFTAPFDGCRYRCNLANSNDGFTISMRRLHSVVPSFRDDLHLDWTIIEPLTKGTGLTLFAGIMGSGKSTTMYATIDKMDKRDRGLLGTVEDPIETIYYGPGVIQREIGTHVESFEQAIRDCVRQNRRTIMVSEIRDPETANAALLAASTGLSVFATIHADSAIDIVQRMSALIDHKYERILPRTLRGLWWQHVLRFADGKRTPLPIYESIEVTGAVRQILEEGPEKYPMLANEMRNQGRKTMAESAMQLVTSGKVKRAEVSEFITRRDRINDF